jgi:hypothetical protein
MPFNAEPARFALKYFEYFAKEQLVHHLGFIGRFSSYGNDG